MTRALRRGIIEVPNSSEAHAALAQLNARLARLQSARLVPDQKELDETTKSLFVGYGVAILSDPGESASLPQMQNEVLEYDALRHSLNCLGEWLQILKVTPRRIFSQEDLNSQIIARALAHQLNVEWTIVQGGDGFAHSKSLIVSADSRSLFAPGLRTIFPAQVIYAFNLHREGAGIMPDVSGVSRAGLVWPWHEERLATRKISTIVERIVSEPSVPTSATWPARLEFYRSRRGLLSAGNSCYSRLSMLPENG